MESNYMIRRWRKFDEIKERDRERKKNGIFLGS